jgi:hypothetical protein
MEVAEKVNKIKHGLCYSVARIAQTFGSKNTTLTLKQINVQ